MTSRELKKRLRGVSRDGAVHSDSSDGSRQSSSEPTVTGRDDAAAGDAAIQSSGLSKHRPLSLCSHYTVVLRLKKISLFPETRPTLVFTLRP